MSSLHCELGVPDYAFMLDDPAIQPNPHRLGPRLSLVRVVPSRVGVTTRAVNEANR